MRTCAVIIAAYNAAAWIGECLNSVERQEGRDGWVYRLRIGVDGCHATAEALDEIGERYWIPERNVGTYVMRNSLIELEPADAYAVFDADDWMFPSYLRRCLAVVEKGAIAGPGKTTRPGTERWSRWAGGVCVIPHEAWRKLGGYRPERIASDDDLHRRARHLRIPVQRIRPALFYLRVHPESLTNRKATNMRSSFRAQTKRGHARARRRGELRVEPVTTPLTLVEP
jgi:glycosyltransferase involved in cell wall biosynthesis